MKEFLCAGVILLAGCAKDEKKPLAVYTPDFIQKSSSIAHPWTMEATPFSWQGRTLLMVSLRDHGTIEIRDGTSVVSSVQTKLQFASAIVSNSTLYLFGTHNNAVFMQSSHDLQAFSEPITVIAQRPDRTLFNTSVTQMPDGSFVMAYETCEAATACYNSRFAVSSDLISWQDRGAILHPDKYDACPTIKFIDGYYYVFHLRDVGHWATYVSRSKDLTLWEHSPRVVLSSYGRDDEGINNSDMDLIEVDGKTIINYAIGDQDKYAHLKFATYNGPMGEFVKEFFK